MGGIHETMAIARSDHDRAGRAPLQNRKKGIVMEIPLQNHILVAIQQINIVLVEDRVQEQELSVTTRETLFSHRSAAESRHLRKKERPPLDSHSRSSSSGSFPESLSLKNPKEERAHLHRDPPLSYREIDYQITVQGPKYLGKTK